MLVNVHLLAKLQLYFFLQNFIITAIKTEMVEIAKEEAVKMLPKYKDAQSSLILSTYNWVLIWDVSTKEAIEKKPHKAIKFALFIKLHWIQKTAKNIISERSIEAKPAA